MFGVVNKVATTKFRKTLYQIAWNYSSKQLYPVDLKDELVDIARNLYLSLKKKLIKKTQIRRGQMLLIVLQNMFLVLN